MGIMNRGIDTICRIAIRAGTEDPESKLQNWLAIVECPRREERGNLERNCEDG